MTKGIVIIPTYNEIENIEAIITAVFALPTAFHVLIVDDNSPDGTAQKVAKLQKLFKDQLFLEVRTKKAGLGTAYVHGFKWALTKGYDYIFEMLMPGKNWADYGISDVITTTEKQKEYIESLFSKKVKAEVIPVSIPDYFKPSDKPKKPIIAISTRDQRDLVKIYKAFYLKYPHLKWVSFRDMRGLPREAFAKSLAESCLAIWVDSLSSFGTFPIESIKCDVPVLGLIPNMVPEWMGDKNGLWANDPLVIADLAANYFQAWLEDGEPQELYDEMSKLKDSYTTSQLKEKVKEVYERIIENRINELKSTLPVEIAVENNVEPQN
jgi:hypothetical protein